MNTKLTKLIAAITISVCSAGSATADGPYRESPYQRNASRPQADSFRRSVPTYDADKLARLRALKQQAFKRTSSGVPMTRGVGSAYQPGSRYQQLLRGNRDIRKISEGATTSRPSTLSTRRSATAIKPNTGLDTYNVGSRRPLNTAQSATRARTRPTATPGRYPSSSVSTSRSSPVSRVRPTANVRYSSPVASTSRNLGQPRIGQSVRARFEKAVGGSSPNVGRPNSVASAKLDRLVRGSDNVVRERPSFSQPQSRPRSGSVASAKLDRLVRGSDNVVRERPSFSQPNSRANSGSAGSSGRPRPSATAPKGGGSRFAKGVKLGGTLSAGLLAYEAGDALIRNKNGEISDEERDARLVDATGGAVGGAVGATIGAAVGGPAGALLGGAIGEHIGRDENVQKGDVGAMINDTGEDIDALGEAIGSLFP